MKYKVVMWHGSDKRLEEKLTALCGDYDANERCFWYEGSLDDFVANYRRPIQVYPEFQDVDMLGVIAVTQYNNFGQR